MVNCYLACHGACISMADDKMKTGFQKLSEVVKKKNWFVSWTWTIEEVKAFIKKILKKWR